MILYDNDSWREDFMALVYGELDSDPTNNRANRIIDAFDSAPAVDAATVIHARWEKKVYREETRYREEISSFHCSNCGGGNSDFLPKYCSNCGARMDKNKE